MLIEHRPKALSKDELQDLVWPGVFVSEANLTSLVTELRKAIGDDAHAPTFVRTVYGFGYAFSGDIEDDRSLRPDLRGSAPPARYRLVWGRKEIVLAEGENILGRGPESIDWIDRDTVSRRHARIVVTGETRRSIEDLGSKNGTYVGGQAADSGSRPLSDGDEFKLGAVPFTFRMLSSQGQRLRV